MTYTVIIFLERKVEINRNDKNIICLHLSTNLKGTECESQLSRWIYLNDDDG